MMDQPGNNHLLLRASQPPSPAYNGQHAAADRMRELLARTVHDHLVEERSVTSALDGLAATLGALDSKLTARLERLDERLDDQYDRVRAMDGKLESQPTGTEETVARAVEAATAGISARIASLEDTVLTLAEALLRPARPLLPFARHSHSMVPGGLLVTSSTTRLTSRTSLVIRVEIRASTSYGSRAQSAVIASSLVTGRRTTGWP